MSPDEVVIYTQPGCPTCSQVKAFLKSRGVAYVEKNVREDEAAWQELHDRGYAATPLTVVRGTEILGLNRTKFEAVLGPRTVSEASS
jgi:glutaredoxin